MRRGRYIVHRRFADGIRATIGQRQIWRFVYQRCLQTQSLLDQVLRRKGRSTGTTKIGKSDQLVYDKLD